MSTDFETHDERRIERERVIASRQVKVDEVDRASFDSFPASDPPSWNGVRLGAPCDTCDPIASPHDAS
ncbi:MAG TPA: hypothetical protein VNS10_18040 [Gemmatimonadaceae bacterium]|jgi:hypothetical protein|nr:hypothetical protein [Gemmatimonadaceae bacterium]